MPPARTATFRTRREHVLGLFVQGRYERALAEAGVLRRRFPSRGEIPFWMACTLCRLGRPDEALAALREGNDHGLWWPAEWLLNDEDLAPLRRGDGLREIVAASQRLHEEHLRTGRPHVPIVLPPAPPPQERTAPGDPPRGTLVALHGWGEQAADFVEPWRAATRAGLMVAVPESSQEPTPAFFVWDDRRRARDDVARALLPLRRRWRLDERRALYAGFSQGGGLAVSWALAGGPLRTGAFLAIGTGLSDVDTDALNTLDQAAAREARGRLIVGAADEALADARALHDALCGAGVPCDLQVVPGLGHDLPDDIDARLTETLGLLIPN